MCLVRLISNVVENLKLRRTTYAMKTGIFFPPPPPPSLSQRAAGLINGQP